ncbi:hypothetical protein [Liquorilactobacillus uvarum]|uniref:hypothetical protein n=1 Tax=Liquorilactobacillus uvarum TaxID=303240 RepID=UPI00288C24AA|nr:hypothetical protein [Liquorilactobacillus uvarum]
MGYKIILSSPKKEAEKKWKIPDFILRWFIPIFWILVAVVCVTIFFATKVNVMSFFTKYGEYFINPDSGAGTFSTVLMVYILQFIL